MEENCDSKVIRKKALIEKIIPKSNSHGEPCIFQICNDGMKKENIGYLYRQPRSQSRTFSLGNEDKNMNLEESMCDRQLFLGVYDEEKGSMELYESSQFIVPLCSGDFSANEESSDSDRDMDIEIMKIGGKRATAIAKRKDLYKFNISEMNESIGATISSVNVGSEDDQIYNVTNYDYLIPPRNTEAKKVKKVYSMKHIVSNEQLSEFNDAAIEAIEEEATSHKFEKYTELFSLCLANIKLMEYNDDEKIRLACAAFYLDSLIFFYKVSDMRVRKAKILDVCCSQSLQSAIKEEFFTIIDDKLLRTKEDKDKLACYIIVLALLINNYELQTDQVIRSLQINFDRLELLCKVIGATIVKRANIVLKLPLTKPTAPRLQLPGKKRMSRK